MGHPIHRFVGADATSRPALDEAQAQAWQEAGKYAFISLLPNDPIISSFALRSCDPENHAVSVEFSCCTKREDRLYGLVARLLVPILRPADWKWGFDAETCLTIPCGDFEDPSAHEATEARRFFQIHTERLGREATLMLKLIYAELREIENKPILKL